MKFLRLLVYLLVGSVLAAASSDAIRNPFLWHVSKGDTEFYLFGTMHLADPSLQVLPDAVEKVMARADAVYTEVSMEPTDQLEATRLMQREDGKRLRSTLSRSTLQKECGVSQVSQSGTEHAAF